MFQKFLDFVKYHNAFAFILGLVFFGIGGAFAASPGTFIQSNDTLRSVDNSYLLSLDLSTYNPTAEITGVTEDAKNYYVAWRLSSVDVESGVWKPVTKDNVLTVSKRLLGKEDLGLYAGKELNDVVGHEKDRLAQTQTREQAGGETLKTVATVYSGLIGKFLKPSEAVFPNYEPVVKPEPTPAEPAPVAPSAPTPSPTESAPSPVGTPSDTTPPAPVPVPPPALPPTPDLTTTPSVATTTPPAIDTATTTPPADTASSTNPNTAPAATTTPVI